MIYRQLLELFLDIVNYGENDYLENDKRISEEFWDKKSGLKLMLNTSFLDLILVSLKIPTICYSCQYIITLPVRNLNY